MARIEMVSNIKNGDLFQVPAVNFREIAAQREISR